MAKEIVTIATPLTFGSEIIRWLRSGDKPERVILREEELQRIGEKLVERIEQECRSTWVFSNYDRDSIELLWNWNTTENRTQYSPTSLKV